MIVYMARIWYWDDDSNDRQMGWEVAFADVDKAKATVVSVIDDDIRIGDVTLADETTKPPVIDVANVKWDRVGNHYITYDYQAYNVELTVVPMTVEE